MEKATRDEVLSAVRSLEQHYLQQSRTLKLIQKIDPLISGIEKYGEALDVFASAKPDVLGLIWGSACIIIRVWHSYLACALVKAQYLASS